MPVPRARSTTASWDVDETTPVCSPAPSAAVSRTPTLVDLVAYGHEDAADGKKDDIDGAAREPEDDTPAGDKNHQLRFPHLPHLPPHPHQHLERFVPPEHYPTTDELTAEKAERARSEDDADPEKAEPISPIAAAAKDDDSYPDGGFKAWSVVAGAWAVSFTAWGKSFECDRLIFRSVPFRGSGENPLSAQLLDDLMGDPSTGWANAFGVLLSYFSTHSLSDYPESSLAWIGAFQIAANLFCAVFSGKLFDAGYVKHLLVAGLLVYTAG
jgi:hypothetical protein